MTPLPTTAADESMEQRVVRLLGRWRQETACQSSGTRITGHPAYRELIALGQAALPYLFRDLEQTGDGHLSKALSAITGANPVPSDERADTQDGGNLAALGQGERLPMVGQLEMVFPGLGASSFRVTSPAARDYNCIAWAAGDTARWWWPDKDPDAALYWPPSVPVEETLGAFAAAFATRGYAPCSSEQLEPGFERVALFVSAGVPTHAARQLSSGRWTSKLGLREDIEHDLHAVSGELYGTVALLLKRPTTIHSVP